MPDFEKTKLIDLVKNKWKIDELLMSNDFKPEENITSIRNGGDLLDQLSIEIGQSLRVLAPPITNCLLCKEKLTDNQSNYPAPCHTSTPDTRDPHRWQLISRRHP